MRPVRTLLFLASLVLAPAAAGQTIVNEGSGDRRDALDAMIFQPAPTAELLAASDWIGEKPSAASLSGKPVLVLTWAEWYRQSHAVAMLGQRLADEHASDGLVVIGVHDGEGWEEAKRFASQRRLSYPIVRDEGGAIREAMRVDQDPDIYVIDRAGNLRFADIATDSARAAVSAVVGEALDEAAGVRQRLAAEAAERDRASRLPTTISGDVDFSQLPPVGFGRPSDEVYAAAGWPEQPEDNSNRRRRDDSGPRSLSLPGDGWFRGRVPKTEGKVVVVYNWHPSDRDTMDRLMFRMDELQRQRARDVVVVGLMAGVAERRRSRNTDPRDNIPVTTETIERFVGNRQIDQYLVASPSGSPIPPISTRNSRRNEALIGAIAVVSTDGIVRRAAHWTEWDDIRRALDTVLRVDPGIQARRDAEDAFIRGRR
ncbi:MAG: TlpA disulfide reductase family protein [Planctomycetota bacterium]